MLNAIGPLPDGACVHLDAGYDSTKTRDLLHILGYDHQIATKGKPSPIQVGKRWVVERTFGWMIRWRRLVRDYEKRLDVSEAMILVALGSNLLRRTTHP